MSDSKLQAVLTTQAPKPIGPYNQAIKVTGANGMVFCSGQIPLDPATNELIEGDVQAQTRQVLANLQAVLTAAGSNLDRVVKTTIFLKSMSDFPKVNEVYGTFFTGTAPARATVEVSRLPKDVLVEIECIALA